MEEAAFYHAVAKAKLGDYGALAKLRTRGKSWAGAYAILAKENADIPVPDPGLSLPSLENAGISLTLFSDADYPPLLREISRPPHALYIKGNSKALLRHPAVAIVGTRCASRLGKETAAHFGRELASCGFMVSSGLAFGIDISAHRGCLDAEGCAVAVLAGGLASVYPRAHDDVAGAIVAAGGALVSEYPPEEQPLAYRFLERNRVISGLAQGTIVIEAPAGSGALSTARFAFEGNRDLFVVPGSVAEKSFEGSNELIKQGAALVTSPGDVLAAYGIAPKNTDGADARGKAVRAKLSPHESLVFGILGGAAEAIDVDKISALAKLEPRIVNQALSFLLIKDLINEGEGGYTIKQ